MARFRRRPLGGMGRVHPGRRPFRDMGEYTLGGDPLELVVERGLACFIPLNKISGEDPPGGYGEIEEETLGGYGEISPWEETFRGYGESTPWEETLQGKGKRRPLGRVHPRRRPCHLILSLSPALSLAGHLYYRWG